MYSWERNTNEYKYETIQHGYEVLEYEDEQDGEDIEEIIETISEEEFDEEFAM
jgi:hypothetical protein